MPLRAGLAASSVERYACHRVVRSAREVLPDEVGGVEGLRFAGVGPEPGAALLRPMIVGVHRRFVVGALLAGIWILASCDGTGSTSTSEDGTGVAAVSTTEVATPATTQLALEGSSPDLTLVSAVPLPAAVATPAQVRTGGEITVTAFCTDPRDPDMWFDDYETNHVLVKLAPNGVETEAGAEHAVTVTVPYYLEPGRHAAAISCSEGSPAPAPAVFEVLPSSNGFAELWEPIRTPWLEAERSPGAEPPASTGDDRSVVALEPGETVTVHALCDSGIPETGARIVLWASLAPTEYDPSFEYDPDVPFVVEFPVDSSGYDRVDSGVVISAEVAPDDVFRYSDTQGANVAASCVPTPTPFTPVTESDDPPAVTLGRTDW